MQVKLTKIKSTHNNIGDDPITGEANALPIVGFIFTMVHPRPGLQLHTRRLVTTEVTDLVFIDETTYEFQTKNSTYKLEIL